MGSRRQPTEERRLLLREGTERGFVFSPWRDDDSLSWPPESSHPLKPAAVSPVFAKNWREERETQGVDREGRERRP